MAGIGPAGRLSGAGDSLSRGSVIDRSLCRGERSEAAGNATFHRAGGLRWDQMTISTRPATALDEAGLRAAIAILASRDPDLAAIVARHGPPPLWARPPG